MKTRTSFSLVIILLITMPVILMAQSFDRDIINIELEPAVKQMLLEGNIPSCSIALVAGEEIVWTNAYGYTNIWARTLAVPRSVYLVGSTFKAMSMYALLQQMDQGKFKLDDPVSKYMGDFKIEGEDPGNPVTFRQMLTHTSGLPGGFGPHMVWGDSVPLTLDEYLNERIKVERPPLEKVEYSNRAYTLIAWLVEKFSGMDYKKYMRENILDMIEMYDTDFYPRSDMEERLAIPYAVDSKSKKNIPATRLKADVWPAGIVYGTILNQANWLITNLNGGVYKGHRFISEETFNEVMTKQYDQFSGPISAGWLNDTTGYGLTWWISERNGDKLFAHSGSVPGYTAFLTGNLDKKTGFAIMTNGNRAHAHLFKLAQKALDVLEMARLDK